MAVLFAISVLQTIARTWKRFQVELHGKYSLQRLRNFHEHSAQISWPQLLFRCIWTLVPCLVYNIIIDMIPLVKPSAGRDANYAFWVRCVFIVLPIAFGIFMQIGFLAPNLDMRPREAGLTSILVTAVCAGYVYTIAGYIAMPVPFVFLTATPPFLTVTFAMFALFYGKKLIRDPKLRLELYRAMAVVISQVTLTVIYPIYIYGFNSIPTLYQTPYMALMPIIKIISKNIKSILIGNMDDLKPEIMFNVDLFNALYVSLAMQKATTISTSLVVMIIDISQACISVYDVYEAYQPLKYQLTKISADYPMHGKNFVEVAIALDEERQRNCIAKTHNASKESRLTLKLLSTQLTEKVAKSNKIFVAATRAGQSSGPRMDAASTIPASTLLNVDAEAFLQATRSLLFTVECVILIEYAEVVIPVFYSTFC